MQVMFFIAIIAGIFINVRLLMGASDEGSEVPIILFGFNVFVVTISFIHLVTQ